MLLWLCIFGEKEHINSAIARPQLYKGRKDTVYSMPNYHWQFTSNERTKLHIKTQGCAVCLGQLFTREKARTCHLFNEEWRNKNCCPTYKLPNQQVEEQGIHQSMRDKAQVPKSTCAYWSYIFALCNSQYLKQHANMKAPFASQLTILVFLFQLKNVSKQTKMNKNVKSHKHVIFILCYLLPNNVIVTTNSTLYVLQLSKNRRQISLARLSLRTEKARFFPAPSFPFPESSPKPNATALADARGTCISYIQQ